MAPPNPLEALTSVECPHTRHRVTCLRCAADAVQPGVHDLEARVRLAEQGRAMYRARLAELVESAVPLGEIEPGEEPGQFTVELGPLNRARGTLGEPLVGQPDPDGITIILTDEDWELAALDAQRRAREAVHAYQAATERSLQYAQKALDAVGRLRAAEARNTALEAALRAALVEHLQESVLECPSGHTGPPPPDCGWCWRNAALQEAIGAVEGRYGATPGDVAKRPGSPRRRPE